MTVHPELAADQWRSWYGLKLFGMVLIAGSVSVRLTMSAITLHWFDVDPSTVDHRATGLLPSWRFFFDGLMLIGAALIFFSHARTGANGIAWWILILAAVPVPILIWWSWHDPADFEQASMWIASVVAAVALAHAASDPALRGIGLALVMAALGPVVIRAIFQVAWEIPSTIAYFDANRAEVLAMRGLEPGSSSAQVFERRLRGAVPTAWFASANLLASVMAAGASVWLAVTVASVRAKLASGISGLAGLITCVMAAIVIISGSMGGIVVLVIGVAFVLLGLVMPQAWRRLSGWAAAVLVVLALVAVPASSLVGDLPGIRSLVIRSGYVAGASDIVTDSPLMGVGPAGFRDAWRLVRSPESPEEIVSPHAMPWDWVAATGVLALTWVGLVLAALICGGRRWWRLQTDVTDDEHRTVGHSTWRWSALIIGFGFTWTKMGELTALGMDVMYGHLLGWGAYVGLAALLAFLWRYVSSAVLLGAFAAAVVVTVHAQVEMSIEQATTAPWILAVLGLVAPVCVRTCRGYDIAGRVGAVVSVLIAGWIFFMGLAPAWQAELSVTVTGRSVQRDSIQTAQANGLLVLSGRTTAMNQLLEAAELRDDDRLRLVAIEQLLTGAALAMACNPPPPEEQLQESRQQAVDVALEVFERTGSVEAGQLAVSALLSSGTQEDLERAVPIAEAVAARDPAGLWSQRYLADVLWDAGEQDVAVEVYRRVLELNEARSIDPLRQLSQSDRVLIQRRIDGQPAATE